jgi:hypothetical protein
MPERSFDFQICERAALISAKARSKKRSESRFVDQHNTVVIVLHERQGKCDGEH